MLPRGPNPYFLRTLRLGFRPWSDDEADLALAHGLWGDSRVTEFIGGPFSDAQVRERLVYELGAFREQGIQYWPIFLLATGEHVGCCGLRPYNFGSGVLELGFHLVTAHRGNGYAEEAARAAIHHAFTTLGAAELFAGHHPDNAASRHLLEKLGFVYARDGFYPPTGLHHPTYRLRGGR